MPREVFAENRRNLLEMLPEDSFAVLNSSDLPWRCADGSLRFIQNSDLFYLTGVDQEDTMLILCPGESDTGLRELLFVRETSDQIRIWEGQKLTREEAAERSGVENVLWNDRFDEKIRYFARKYRRIYLNHNEHARASSPMGTTPDDRFRSRLQDLFPEHRYERLAPDLHRLRQVKSEEELAPLKRACDITEKGFRRVLGFIRPGVREYEVESEFAHEFLSHGSRGFAYEPIVASGVNACALHYLDNDQECRDGDLLLMDVAAEYGGYNADLTRTVPVNGKFSDRQRAVYNAVLRVFRRCIDELIVPGKDIRKEFNPEVGRAMEEELVELGLIDRAEVEKERSEDPPMKEEKRCYRKYFMHGTCHSLGIDVHDVTPPDPCFVENMLVTVEPGIYIPDEGIGVRLENDILVRKAGNIDLMASIPIEPEEIESLMQR